MNNWNTKLDLILERLETLVRIMSIQTGHSMGFDGHDFFTSSDDLSGKRFTAIGGLDTTGGGTNAQVDYTVVRDDGTEISHTNVTLVDGNPPIVGTIIKVNVDSGEIIAYYGKDYK